MGQEPGVYPEEDYESNLVEWWGFHRSASDSASMHLSVIHVIISVQVFHQARLQFMPPMPYPMPMGMPAGPVPAPMPLPMPLGMPAGPMPAPMPMPMPMPLPLPQPRLPVVVMPYYSKAKKRRPAKRYRKRRPRRKYVSSSCESSDTDVSSSSDIDFRASQRRSRQVLTPVVSYMTKNGYVVYQKKIKNEKAKDWLRTNGGAEEIRDEELTEQDLWKEKLSKRKRRHHNH
ncbi:uncharacterized protein LOC135076426 [Ostrinia nubilalis]|uniref:uncharacterized protein LOC135076426 n=1 Tax=Ostrinia nubilalis TaxID=29057 RepID=UPI0030823781